MSQSLFSFYYDPHIYIDTSDAPSTINFRVHLQVFNQCSQTLWFRLSQPHSEITPSFINLGSVGANSNSFFVVTFSVPKPSQDVTYSGYWKIEAFTDSNYSNKITEATKYTEVRLFDLSNWNTIGFYTFDDGTLQGWTIVKDANLYTDWSVYPGGYSLGRCESLSYSVFLTPEFYKNEQLPNVNNIIMSFYLFYSTNDPVNNYFSTNVLVDDKVVFSFRRDMFASTYGPYKYCINLSPFKNGTRTIRFSTTFRLYGGKWAKLLVDNIRIAYKT